MPRLRPILRLTGTGRVNQTSFSSSSSLTDSTYPLSYTSTDIAIDTSHLPISASLDLSALESLGTSCPDAQSFLSRIQTIESQLQKLRADRDALQRRFEASCQLGLRSALERLDNLVAMVTEADRAILFWHSKPATRPLRLALKLLKPIGRDKEVHTLIARKGGVIRARADEVSSAFALCGQVCEDSLVQVQDLHLRTNDLVSVGIHGLQNDAQDLKRGYERKQRDLQLSIDKKGVDAAEVRSQAARTRVQVREVEKQSQKARRGAKNSSALSAAGIGSGFLIGALCLIFPPAGAAAAVGAGALGVGAVGVGVSSAVVASDFNADVRRLEAEQDRFQDRLDDLEYELSDLRSEMSSLEGSKSGYDAAIRCAGNLEAGCSQLQKQTNQFLRELNGARIVLTRGITKSHALASALERCEYARTRIDFVSRVQAVLEDFQACVPTSGSGGHGVVMIGNDEKTRTSQLQRINSVTCQLDNVQQKTDRVVGVLRKVL